MQTSPKLIDLNFCISVSYESNDKYGCVLQDIFKQATEDRLTSANELPYFEGDFWPNVLEESIKELEQEEEERKKEENTAACETPEVRFCFLQDWIKLCYSVDWIYFRS